MVQVSVIVPAHNEEELIGTFLRDVTLACRKLKFKYEIIVVENGSKDRTIEIVKYSSSQNKSIKLLSLPKAAYGSALIHGLNAATGKYLVVFNVDFWDSKFLALTNKDLLGNDLVVGSKLLSDSRDFRPASRKLVTRIFNKLLNIIFSYPGTDTHGIKVLRRRTVIPIVEKCVINSGIFDSELMIRAYQSKLRILELPVVLAEVRPARFNYTRILRTPVDLWNLVRAVLPIRAEIILLSLFVLTFIFIRSLHFVSSLNFSTDPALFSTAAWDIWQNKSIRLIGPTFSVNFAGRYAFQGSVIYYFQLVFLLLGHWDPVFSSYIFMLFCAAMIFPLYFGVKMLINKQAALLMTIVYCLVPYYINYTKFLWNPNFQFSLTPLVILFMGMYKKYSKSRLLFLTGLLTGIIVQFHYQFSLIIFGLTIYYLLISRHRFFIFLSGLIIGFSPILLFELRHNFYNLNTILLFMANRGHIGNNPIIAPSDYYFLSLSLFLFLGLLGILKKIKLPLGLVTLLLVILSLILYLPSPTHGFRMFDNWKYLDELKVHRIIMENNLSNFNIVNLIYDPQAAVQKYLLKKDGVNIISNDYLNNNYLFIITSKKNFLADKAYEITSLGLSKSINSWQINPVYFLYLQERLTAK